MKPRHKRFAAVAVGVAGLFMEIHPHPESALSDGPNSARLKDAPSMLNLLKKIDQLIK
jgi:2-dehydro-3-deoxyphosphooctonate aldolase (KDO 8-P synthase)